MAMLFTIGANAADLVWIGGTGNWNAAGNWSPSQLPTAADNAIITNHGTYTVNRIDAQNAAVACAARVDVAARIGRETRRSRYLERRGRFWRRTLVAEVHARPLTGTGAGQRDYEGRLGKWILGVSAIEESETSNNQQQ
jgi:hypothetical protein